MKIAFITDEYPPENRGGAGISSELIVRQLRDRGFTVDVYALNATDDPRREDEQYYRLPAGDSFRMPHLVARSFSAYRYLPDLDEYDLAHVYGPAHLPGVILHADIPVVTTVVNFGWVCINPDKYLEDNCPPYDLRQAIANARLDDSLPVAVLRSVAEAAGRKIANTADVITVQTAGMKDVLARCGYDNEKIRVVPNLVDPQFFVESDECEREATRELVFVGRLTERKGARDVVKAFSKVDPDKRNGWSLRLYGDGPLKSELEAYAQDDPAITLDYCPYEEMPKRVYGRATAVVHASKYPEPFSRVWLEAMATNSPLICSQNPSSESVLRGVAELYDPFDSDRLRTTLERVLSNADARSRLAEKGREAVEQYQPANVIKQYVSIYESVV